jgi:delta1-piperideine-2-carboxylate reductase
MPAMGGRHISVDEGRALAATVLERAGLPADEAAAVADIVICSELTGYPQIGLARLPRLAEYVRRVERRPIRVERDGPFSAHLEAGGALGYVTALRMVEVCAEKVRASGVGLVTANGSGLTGRNAYYVERLAEQGWVAVMVNNFTPVVAPHDSSEAVFGTNPLSIAMPATGTPLVVDISVASLIDADLRFHRLEGRPLPEGLAFDAEGNATTDAAAALGGAVRAFGEHRGSALALAVQALGVLAGSPPVPAQPEESGVFLLAFDPALFGDPDDIAARLGELLERVRRARPADPDVPVRAPNDRALASMDAVRAQGIALSDELADALETLQ